MAAAQTADQVRQAAEQVRAAQERAAVERQEQRQRQLLPESRVQLQAPREPLAQGRLTADEQPCFVITQVVFEGLQGKPFSEADLLAALQGPDRADPPFGRCLGAQSVSLLMARAQDALIARGFVTTRVLAPPQDLKEGTLKLQVLAGRVARIVLAQPQGRAQLTNALPLREGDVLQVRDIEQGLENLKRVPSAEADIRVVPGAEPGTSDLVVDWKQGQGWRLSLSADDSGSKSTGKFQGSVTLSVDHALALNDLFYLTASNDMGGADPGPRGTRGLNAHYSLPWGYWQLAFNSGRNRYHQSVAGANQTYRYSGLSSQADVTLSRLIYRDSSSKFSASLKAFARRSQNFIDDTEVEVQRRQVGGYQWGLGYSGQWRAVQVSGNLAYKRGTKAFGANEAPEEPFGEGTHQFRLYTMDLNWSLPVAHSDGRLNYQGNWRWQNNRSPLTPQDRFTIGGRYTVRGFDGQNSLSAERGWLLRNELSTPAWSAEHRVYWALDHGRLGGPSAQAQLGKKLTGFATGLRGRVARLQYDIFFGLPLSMPGGFRTTSTTGGISVSAQF